jgi:hypothetical protein
MFLVAAGEVFSLSSTGTKAIFLLAYYFLSRAASAGQKTITMVPNYFPLGLNVFCVNIIK